MLLLPSGSAIRRLGHDADAVVVVAGSNDAQRLAAGQVTPRQVRGWIESAPDALSGVDCVLWANVATGAPTIYWSTSHAPALVNAVLADQAARRPNVDLVDWAATAAEPALLLADGLHHTVAGETRMVEDLTAATDGCLRHERREERGEVTSRRRPSRAQAPIHGLLFQECFVASSVLPGPGVTRRQRPARVEHQTAGSRSHLCRDGGHCGGDLGTAGQVDRAVLRSAPRLERAQRHRAGVTLPLGVATYSRLVLQYRRIRKRLRALCQVFVEKSKLHRLV